MPLSTDTTWPACLLKIFEICRNKLQPLESRYYGPYTKLLTYCFGPDSFDFFVAPQSLPSEVSLHDAIDFVVFLIVFDADCRPMFIAEIKDDAWATKADLRLKADNQIRQRYDSMLPDCPIPRFWGLSLLGTSLRVYCGDIATNNVTPAFEDRPSPGRVLPRNFLEGAWNIDILSQEGFDKMKEIVEDIVGSAAMLQ
ncbi:hypothetical protein APHAL10511_000360 [Amanita phalloides]|nr:hypothetical protein APHAL10511_000360 [Amanita phalloides]